jgi:hypothetical protein
MPLKIVHAYDTITIERIIVALYSGPGLGKSTLAFTADDPIMLDFDGGSYRAKNRGDVVQCGKWTDVALMQASDLAGYKTAIVDTAGRALDRLSEKLITDNPKNATGAGALSLQGYGELKSTFAAWLKRLTSFGLDVVLVSHASEERKGEDIIERLDVQGSSRGEIHKSADAMGRLYIQNGERWLTFSPSDAAFGKNPANMEAMLVPNTDANPKFLGQVIAEIKRVLNQQSEAGREMRVKIEAARTTYLALDTPEKFTAQAEELTKANADRAIKATLLAVATEKGYTFDRDKKAFVVAPKTEQPAPVSATSSDAQGDGPQQVELPTAAAKKTATRREPSGGRRRTA